MSLARDCQMQEALARALRFRERMPNTEAAGYAAMDTAASIMELVSAAGLTLTQTSTMRRQGDPWCFCAEAVLTQSDQESSYLSS